MHLRCICDAFATHMRLIYGCAMFFYVFIHCTSDVICVFFVVVVVVVLVLVLVVVVVVVQVLVCKYLRRDGLTKSGEDPLNLGLPRSQLPHLLPDQTTIDVNKLKTIEVITCVGGS